MKSITIRNSNNTIILKIKKTKNGYDIKKLAHVDKLYITIVDEANKRTFTVV